MPGHPYEDFFFQELVPTVEFRYKIYGDKAHRAVMGLSMGGGGSAVYAQRHPDLFSSCYAMSGWLDNPEPNADMPKDKFYLVSKAVHEHSTLAFIDQADDATLEKLRTVKWFFDCGDDDGLMDLSVDPARTPSRSGRRCCGCPRRPIAAPRPAPACNSRPPRCRARRRRSR